MAASESGTERRPRRKGVSVLVNSGRVQILKQFAGLAATEGLLWGLIQNFPKITPTTVLADLQEVSWPGYARQPTPLAAWMPPIIDPANNAASMAIPPIVFLNSDVKAWTASGWFVVGAVSGILYAAALFAPGFVIQANTHETLHPQLLVNNI